MADLGLPKDPKAAIPPEQIRNVLRNVLAMFFPLLAPTTASPGSPGTS